MQLAGYWVLVVDDPGVAKVYLEGVAHPLQTRLDEVRGQICLV
jgi:hypothetical protein